MRAVLAQAAGGPEVLTLVEAERPEPRAGQVLIKVAYAGVNRPDTLQRAGLYKAPRDASPYLGLEVAGEVVALGVGAQGVALGDRVCALVHGGGYADYVACAAAHCLPVPEGLSLREAACLPETCFTVWSNVVMRAGLRAGERFLVHGGASGIGTTAIQIARLLGARVFATAGSAEKVAACAGLGARAIAYREEDFVEVLQAEGGADVILDMVGGSYIARNIKALADDGRMVSIAFLEGPKAEINFAQIMLRRLTLTGSTLRPQSDGKKAEIAEALRARLWPHVASGALRPLIDSEFPLEEAAEAHRRMESGAHIGKIVLKL